MANLTIYTRVYSKGSAGRFVAAKAPKGDPLSDTDLIREFRNHSDAGNRVPTALVSGSDRIIDTLMRAFDKHYGDCESAADIWIAFIEVPPITSESATIIHSAKELAEKCKLPEPNKFSHEVVFEWVIPEKYVVHEVSLQILMNRGLQERHFYQSSTKEVRSTMEARRYTARKFQRLDPWEIGIALGIFAQKFGARAPLDWVSHQLFYDCVQAKILNDDVVRLTYAPWRTQIVDFQFFCDLDEGVNTSLYEWWLSDLEFFLEVEEFNERRDVTEDSMAWDLIDFCETWHDVDRDGKTKELSMKERISYNEAKNHLLVKHEMKRAAIEAEAVKMGL